MIQDTIDKTITTPIKDTLAEMPDKATLLRVFRMWRHKRFISITRHDDVVQSVVEDGSMTYRYAFMVTMSCAIAILGLLLSSPAVVIGAMLISPLMGPIVSLGFSLCIMDIWQLRKALVAIGLGFLLSLTVSMLIVYVSPLTDPTPEILARTRPNLFDLMVAIFSGLAGGYAVIKNKGSAIVGVAIATALMPPLAVVGYGLATGSWIIARGAFFLFMTNLLAISLSVSALAKWYGFGWYNGPKHTLVHTLMMFVVFVVLSIPLGISLSNIAYQSYATKTARAEIQKYFHFASSRISNFSIAFQRNGDINVDCILVTDFYAPNAQGEIRETLEKTLEKRVILSLDQIVLTKGEQKKIEIAETPQPDTALANPMQAKSSMLTIQEEMAQAIKNSLFFPLNFVRVDPEKDIVIIYPKPSKGANLTVLRSIEEKLRGRFLGWSVFVIPPVQALPSVFYDMGKDIPAGMEEEKLGDIIWALQRWEVKEVDVIGYASSIGEFESFNNTSLAYRRADFLVKKLSDAGIESSPRAEYGGANQKREEKAYGLNSFQRVEIRLVAEPETAQGTAGDAPLGVPILPDAGENPAKETKNTEGDDPEGTVMAGG